MKCKKCGDEFSPFSRYDVATDHCPECARQLPPSPGELNGLREEWAAREEDRKATCPECVEHCEAMCLPAAKCKHCDKCICVNARQIRSRQKDLAEAEERAMTLWTN